MARMQLDKTQRDAAIKLFNEGKADDFPLHDVLAQFRRECHRRINLIQMFLEIQISTAFADQKLHAAEKNILYTIADELGFSRDQLDHLFHLAGGVATPKTAKALQIHLKTSQENQIQDPKLTDVFKDREIVENAQHIGSDQCPTDQQTEHTRKPEALRDQWTENNDQAQ